MAAVHRSPDDCCVAASFRSAAAGYRRCRCARLFALVLGLSGCRPVQLLYCLADRAARLWTRSRIRWRDPIGPGDNPLQDRDVLGHARRPIARAILAATGGEPGPVRRAVAASWHWVFIALSLGIFFGSGIEFALGKGAWVARAATATQGIVVALAVVGQASHNLIGRLCPGDAADIRVALRRARFRRALSRLADTFLWILGAAWLCETWGLDLIDPEPGSVERMILRPAL